MTFLKVHWWREGSDVRHTEYLATSTVQRVKWEHRKDFNILHLKAAGGEWSLKIQPDTWGRSPKSNFDEWLNDPALNSTRNHDIQGELWEEE